MLAAELTSRFNIAELVTAIAVTILAVLAVARRG